MSRSGRCGPGSSPPPAGRSAAIPELQTDLRLRYRDQDYQVRYFYPNYRDGGFLDLFVRLVIEDGVKSF